MAVIIYKNTNVGNITPLSELLVVDTIEQPLPQCDLSNIDQAFPLIKDKNCSLNDLVI